MPLHSSSTTHFSVNSVGKAKVIALPVVHHLIKHREVATMSA